MVAASCVWAVIRRACRQLREWLDEVEAFWGGQLAAFKAHAEQPRRRPGEEEAEGQEQGGDPHWAFTSILTSRFLRRSASVLLISVRLRCSARLSICAMRVLRQPGET